jgi:hyperosmotically inducible protein
MKKLFLLAFVGAVALGAYNYSNGRDLFDLPSISAGDVKDTVRETVRDTVRDTVRETRDEAKERARDAARAAVHSTEDAVSGMTLTTKIKTKMALDDLVDAGDINVDTEGSVVTLTGEVASADEQRRAVRLATETKGVTQVVTRLKVRD